MNISHFRKVRQLYKSILKMHNGLPEHIKAIGNGYVREEFRRHKTCTEKEGAIFLEEWTKYAVVLAQQIGLKGPISAQKLGRQLTLDELDNMSEDQIYQLYKLMLAAQGKNENEEEMNSVQ
ncbi:hypothetical protein RUM44_006416 [Polyplax serrata]|uniref:Succinate dehydrogenase assembly factor 3 n=1 Tax=Polyplax serrata TaxID=468196 RepID=A0ABR1AJS1_POLSC